MADIEHLKALEAQATPGPLRVSDGVNEHGVAIRTDDDFDLQVAWCGVASSYVPSGYRRTDPKTIVANARLFAAMRNAAPAMLEVCAAAKAWNDVDRELDPVGYARAVRRLMCAVKAMEASRG